MWQLWIDTGGTFTDCIAIDPAGNKKHLKILSNSSLRGKIIETDGEQITCHFSWGIDEDIFAAYHFEILKTGFKARVVSVDLQEKVITLDKSPGKDSAGSEFQISPGEEVPILAARMLTHTPLHKPLPRLHMKLGSTKGTNALLERKGAKVLFLATKGFKDLLVIGDQQRPHLFALNISTSPPLYEEVLEVEERMDSTGKVIHDLDTRKLRSMVKDLPKDTAIAVAFMNSYLNDQHEQEVKRLLAQLGFKYTSCSAEISKAIKILPRAETSVANAYLQPVISGYIGGIRQKIGKGKLQVMTSSGAIVDAGQFYPKDSLLSGPAGGIVGAVKTAQRAGVSKLVTFDMGGTSTDVAIYNEEYDYTYETRVGDARIVSPSLHIETIAAGGGSICSFHEGMLTVGPGSAGAHPGPACYGAGGPLCITDINLLSGKLVPGGFSIPVSDGYSKHALNTIIDEIASRHGKTYTQEELLKAFTTIANEKMAEAIRKVSLQKGHDPKDYTLLTFGGAGAQHACSIAHLLGMKKILVPYEAGLLSAYGIGNASIEVFAEQPVLKRWSQATDIPPLWTQLQTQAFKELLDQGYDINSLQVKKRFFYLRFAGQENTIEVEDSPNVLEDFKEAYQKLYGHWLDGHEVEIESLKLIAGVEIEQDIDTVEGIETYYQPSAGFFQPSFTDNEWVTTPVYQWETLKAGARITGPAILLSHNTTVFLEKGWELHLDANKTALLNYVSSTHTAEVESEEANLELYKNRFMSIVEDMGAILQRTSFSVNVKERLDFSCALMDAAGYLVVNAPHIPVHLGSMGVCVRKVAEVLPMEEGDIVITNHPAFGGSHLPDITLISPVYFKSEKIGYVATRAHHAEIGGKTPGSMPADAKSLEEEGVIIAPQYLVKRGLERWEKVKKVLTDTPYPTRSLEENLADLRGGIASIMIGIQGARSLCETFGRETVTGYMTRLKDYVAETLQKSIARWHGKFEAEERLDDGSQLHACLTLGKKLRFDFSGTSAVHPNNLNATEAIVNSVVLYVLRLLLNKDLPLNEGLLENVEVILPRSILNPGFTQDPLPAVVGGNTEVSQRLTDTLLKALNLAACSQGTMNNLLFGNDRFGYYETICGGTGAGEGFHGHHAIHQHMTNTKITDPEIIEHRYPVRLDQFTLRKGSGGEGQWHGGDGIVRGYTFLQKLNLTLLTQHRVETPYGGEGGEPGQPGKQRLIYKNGQEEELPGVDNKIVEPGDQLIIETPGGGGWGVKSTGQ